MPMGRGPRARTGAYLRVTASRSVSGRELGWRTDVPGVHHLPWDISLRSGQGTAQCESIPFAVETASTAAKAFRMRRRGPIQMMADADKKADAGKKNDNKNHPFGD